LRVPQSKPGVYSRDVVSASLKVMHLLTVL
jgi:hypothetical protein